MDDIREICMFVGNAFNDICNEKPRWCDDLDDWSGSEECATVAKLVCEMVKVLNVSVRETTEAVIDLIIHKGFRKVEDHAWDEYVRGFLAGQILGTPTEENKKLLEKAEEMWDYDSNNGCKYGYFQEVLEEVKKGAKPWMK